MDLSKTGKTIAKLRRSAGFTQASLAEKLGISDKAVSKWERGIACPDVSLWNKLSILLDTDIESLIYGHDGRNEWKGMLVLDEGISCDTLIFNKPLIHYLLSQFLLVGINDITIIGGCTPPSLPGVRIKVIDSISKVNHWFTNPTFFIYGNSFLYGPNLTKHFKRAMSRTDEITIISSMKRNGFYPIEVDENRKAKLTDKLVPNQYYAEPFAFVPAGIGYTKYAVFEDILKSDNLNAETMVRGMMSFHVSSYEDAFRLSEFVKMMEELSGERIGCVEEILIRRGVAEYEDIVGVCDNDTRRYLKELFQ